MQTVQNPIADILASVRLHDVLEDREAFATGDVLVVDGTSINGIPFTADPDIAQLVMAMTTIGETFDAVLRDAGDRFEIVGMPGYTDADWQPSAPHPTIAAIASMDGPPAQDVLLDGFAGIRLVVRPVRDDASTVRYDLNAPEHVVLTLPLPPEGLPASIVADALWSARYAELAATAAFVAERRAACTGAPPERFPEITAENLRRRTRLAAMGLVPSPIGRTYEHVALLWCRCAVEERADGWLDVSMVLDS
jgi:hypothetical protein